MTRECALELIDNHKNTLTDPIELLHWTWLRTIVFHVSKEHWEEALADALQVLAAG
jgi:hypothetical protein